MKINWWAVIIFSSAVFYLTVMITTQSFGVRCYKAGFEGAEYERCIIRLKSGATVYEENVGYIPGERHE